MNKADALKAFDLRQHLSTGEKFTSGGIRDLLITETGILPDQLEMADVFSAIAALNQQPGDVQILGAHYVYDPLPIPPANTTRLNP
jgi:hypothetical protein